MPWWGYVLAGFVVGALFVAAVCLVGGQSHERRGGYVELDSWEARNAMRLRDGETAIVRAEARFLGRCGHLIHAGNDYVVRQRDGARFCSPRCAEASPTSSGIRPFAGGGDAA